MLSKNDIIKIAIDESLLLEDFKNANNYVGIKIQEGKIEILDLILEIEK